MPEAAIDEHGDAEPLNQKIGVAGDAPWVQAPSSKLMPSQQ
jgi:hypothetical protein